jgi:hypothetical protein
MKKINKNSWLRITSVIMSFSLIALFSTGCGEGGKKKAGSNAAMGAPRGKESFQDIVK